MDNHDHPADERRLQAAERAELHSTDGSMSTCAVCGESLPDNRPAHRVVLEIEDRTRSTKQFMGDETNIKRLCLDRELCGRCWNGWYGRLASV